MLDTNSDIGDTKADKSTYITEVSDQTYYSAAWARIGYVTLCRNAKEDRCDFDQFGYDINQLFVEPTVDVRVWLHINSVGQMNVVNWEVEIAKAAKYSSHALMNGLVSSGETGYEVLQALTRVIPKIDSTVEGRLIDDGQYVWLHCHYPSLDEAMLPVWSCSSAQLVNSLVLASLGFDVDRLIGFTYARWAMGAGESHMDRQLEYHQLFGANSRVRFSQKAELVALRGYFIRWLKSDLEMNNVLYDLRTELPQHLIEMTTVDAVQKIMQENLKKLPSKEVAKRLHISDRELRRRLDDEGTSYKKLSDAHLLNLWGSPVFNTKPLAKAAKEMGYGSGQSLKRAIASARKKLPVT